MLQFVAGDTVGAGVLTDQERGEHFTVYGARNKLLKRLARIPSQLPVHLINRLLLCARHSIKVLNKHALKLSLHAWIVLWTTLNFKPYREKLRQRALELWGDRRPDHDALDVKLTSQRKILRSGIRDDNEDSGVTHGAMYIDGGIKKLGATDEFGGSTLFIDV